MNADWVSTLVIALLCISVLVAYRSYWLLKNASDSQELTDRKLDAIRVELAGTRADLHRLREDLQNHRAFINRVLTKNGYPREEP